MSDFNVDKKYCITHPDGWRYFIEDGEDNCLINIYYEEEIGDSWKKELLIQGLWKESLDKFIEVFSDIKRNYEQK
jgi:hypothetical protein